MIYTLTLNPSLDYISFVDTFTVGTINRTSNQLIFPGGKGINVSLVLKNFGYESTALGFPAGFSGKEIARLLKEREINTDFTFLTEGCSRINLKIKSDKETELNGPGPFVPKSALCDLFDKLKRLSSEDYLVLSGSLPKGVPENIYSIIMDALRDASPKVIIDTTGNALTDTLKYRPFLVKPNNHELSDIFNAVVTTRKEALIYGQKLVDMGAQNVLVSMGKDGAVFVSETGMTFETDAPKGELINSVGAGDSMVAGFLYEYIKSSDFEKSFRTAVCFGSASAFCEGMATPEKVNELYVQLHSC